MMKRGNLGWVVFSLILGFSSAARSAPVNEALVNGAKKEGSLLLYLSTNLADANGMIQRFNQKYPFIQVNLYRAENERLLNRILTEARAGKFVADVVLISSFEVRVLIQRDLLRKYVSPESRHYPEGFKDPEGFWTSVYSIPRVIGYNTRLVTPDLAPKSFDDLLQPRWKGKILMSDSAFLWFTGFLNFRGEEKGREYMRRLAAQMPGFQSGATLINQLVAAGEYPIGASDVYSHNVEAMKKKGAPIDWVRAAEPIVTGLKPIGLSSKALHPNAAKLFIDFALSTEGQELIRSFSRIPDRDDVPSDPPYLKSGVKLYPANPTWGDSYSRYVKEFREIFQK